MKLKSGLYETENYHCLGNLNNDNVDFRLVYCGYENCEPGHRFGPNRRTAYVLHVVASGKGRLEIGDEVYHLSEGDAFLLKPEEEAWYMADFNEPWSYMWIGFQGMQAHECVMNAGFDNDNHVIHGVDHNPLRGYIMEMLKAHSLSYSNSLRRSSYLQMFFADLIEQYRKNIQGIENLESIPGAEQVKRLMIYITEHYKEKIRINEVAYEMGINRCYLSTAFKKMTGYSPAEYLLQVRMEKAKSLLMKTNYSINRIATEVGYADQLAFSRMFKRRFGESPARYRQEAEQLEICNQKVALEDALL